ncbi:MAG: 50S ribosomal protein L37Ae [Methanobacteriota archaeon]|nr:MAG: 50S ribosomal protein L37Ae [Euryarchaeota archaeon]
MGKRTKKVGPTGKYGPRYGVKVRKRLKEVETAKSRKYICPNCNHQSVKRVGTGIWKCRRCNLVFAGGAYRPFVSTSYRKETGRGPQTIEEEPAEGEENV